MKFLGGNSYQLEGVNGQIASGYRNRLLVPTSQVGTELSEYMRAHSVQPLSFTTFGNPQAEVEVILSNDPIIWLNFGLGQWVIRGKRRDVILPEKQQVNGHGKAIIQTHIEPSETEAFLAAFLALWGDTFRYENRAVSGIQTPPHLRQTREITLCYSPDIDVIANSTKAVMEVRKLQETIDSYDFRKFMGEVDKFIHIPRNDKRRYNLPKLPFKAMEMEVLRYD